MRPPATLMPITAAIVLAVASAAGAATAIKAAKMQTIVVDGVVGDWEGVPVQYFDKGPRVTAIAHDDRFLYVQFRFSDLALARRVLRTGAIVWVNGAGDHEASFGLRYRGSAAAEKALMAAGTDGGTQPAGMTPPPAGQSTPPGDAPGGGAPPSGRGPEPAGRAPLGAVEVLRLGVVDEVIDSGTAPDGAAAACGVADGVFAYELRIPLAELALAGVAGAPLTVAVGFQMGGMTPAERDAMRERMRSSGGPPGGGGGMPGGGGGGMPGGGGGMRGGGPGGGPSGGRESRARSSETVWVDVELAGIAPAGVAKQQ